MCVLVSVLPGFHLIQILQAVLSSKSQVGTFHHTVAWSQRQTCCWINSFNFTTTLWTLPLPICTRYNLHFKRQRAGSSSLDEKVFLKVSQHYLIAPLGAHKLTECSHSLLLLASHSPLPTRPLPPPPLLQMKASKRSWCPHLHPPPAALLLLSPVWFIVQTVSSLLPMVIRAHSVVSWTLIWK